MKSGLSSTLLLGFFTCVGLAQGAGMAAMSLTSGIFFLMSVAAFFAAPGPLRKTSSPFLCSNGELAGYSLATLSVVLAFSLSLFVPLLSPIFLFPNGPRIPVEIGDFGKFWYFVLPFSFAFGFRLWDQSLSRTKILLVWKLGFFFLCCLGLQQVLSGWPHRQEVPGSNNLLFHATLLYGHHLSTSSLFGLLVPLLLLSPKPITKALGVMGLLVLILTFSRMAWLALPLTFLAWLLLRHFSMKRILLGTFGILMAAFALYHVPFIQMRFLDSFGSSTRFALWRLNFEFFTGHPLTGIGLRKTIWASAEWLKSFPGSLPDGFSGHAHNNLLDLLTGTGVIGALSYLGWSAIPLYSCLKHSQRKGLDAWKFEGIFCGLVLFHLQGLTQVNGLEGKVQTGLAFLLGYWIFLANLKSATFRQQGVL